MGSFAGHVVPGTFFTCFGIWWTYNIFYRYYYAKRFRPSSYRNVSRFSCTLSNRLPAESLVKVVCTLIGIAGELATSFRDGKFVQFGNAQHMTMYFFFGFNGVVDLLQHKKWDLPPKLDYVTAAIAFGIEGFLFYNHLHGRSHMDIQVHMFLFYAIVGSLSSSLLEMQNPKSVLAALARAFFTLLQGTWFFQIGFILYPPIGDKWDEGNHDQMMIITLIYAWHVAALLMTISGFGLIIYSRVQKLKVTTVNYHLVESGPADGSSSSNFNEKPHPSNNGYLKALGDQEEDQMLDSESEDV